MLPLSELQNPSDAIGFIFFISSAHDERFLSSFFDDRVIKISDETKPARIRKTIFRFASLFEPSLRLRDEISSRMIRLLTNLERIRYITRI